MAESAGGQDKSIEFDWSGRTEKDLGCKMTENLPMKAPNHQEKHSTAALLWLVWFPKRLLKPHQLDWLFWPIKDTENFTNFSSTAQQHLQWGSIKPEVFLHQASTSSKSTKLFSTLFYFMFSSSNHPFKIFSLPSHSLSNVDKMVSAAFLVCGYLL